MIFQLFPWSNHIVDKNQAVLKIGGWKLCGLNEVAGWGLWVGQEDW